MKEKTRIIRVENQVEITSPLLFNDYLSNEYFLNRLIAYANIPIIQILRNCSKH